MSAKFGASGLLKIKVLLQKSYDVITHVRDAINKVLSRDSNFVVRVDK